MKGELLDYLVMKYPKSEDKEINLGLKGIVEEVDRMAKNQKDLLLQSQVPFHYKEGQDYNPEIMRFLNYLMGLPSTEIQRDGQKISLGKCFHQDMEILLARGEEFSMHKS